MPILLPLMIAAAAPAPTHRAGDFDFTYSYPANAARIAPLKAWLDADRAALGARYARMAASAKAEARKSGYPYRRYDVSKTWKVVTETPRLLSLSVDNYAYTGGAHGNPATGSLVWDKAAHRRLKPLDLFASPAAVEAAIRAPYCAALNREQAKRRGGPVAVKADDPFSQCPPLKDLVVLLGSTDRQRIDRIGLIADPYVAGPYAEGRYDITLPVTPRLLAAVRPAYRAAVAAR